MTALRTRQEKAAPPACSPKRATPSRTDRNTAPTRTRTTSAAASEGAEESRDNALGLTKAEAAAMLPVLEGLTADGLHY